MTTIDEVPWSDGTPAEPRLLLHTPRRCRHPREKRSVLLDGTGAWVCTCGHVAAVAVVRRNRNNRKRGQSIELKVCRDLGVTPRGRYGDPVDGGSDEDAYLVQVKTGGYYKPAQHVILDAMAGQRRDRVAVLVTVETPGSESGRAGRRLVTLDYDDWKRVAEALGWSHPPSPGPTSPASD